jgi:CRISPR-associated protein Csb2
VPTDGTLDDLVCRHRAFLNRIGRDDKGNESFNPVPPLSKFRVIGYRLATAPPQRHFAAFSLLRPDASHYRAFDTARKALTVAGMMRSAVKTAAQQTRSDESQWIDSFVLGHGEAKGQTHQPVGPDRFAYLPLPSIEYRGEDHAKVVGAVRRVLIAVLADGRQQEVTWAGQSLSGAELIDQDNAQPQAVLSRLPNNDRQVRHYVRPASTWATVTPMVLPGYDDCRRYRRRLKDNSDADNQKRWLGKLEERIDALIRKAIGQAGFSDVLRQQAIIEWRATGYWPGTELVSRYGVPSHLQKFSRYHVRIQWRDEKGQPVQVPGPICIGGGRFCGLGLFAAQDDTL